MWLFFPTNAGKLWGFLKQSLISFFFFFIITDDFILLEFNASVSLGKLIDYVCCVCTTLIELIWWVWAWLMHARNGQKPAQWMQARRQLRVLKTKECSSELSSAVFPAFCCSEKYQTFHFFCFCCYLYQVLKKYFCSRKV